MSLLQADPVTTELGALRNEVADLKEKLVRLTAGSASISNDQNVQSALQEVVNSACQLTGARSGELRLLDMGDGVPGFFTYGDVSASENHGSPVGRVSAPSGLTNGTTTPDSPEDMATCPEAACVRIGQHPGETSIELPICRRGEHFGTLHLSDKDGGAEFTDEDENVAAMFAAQAASITSSARKYDEAYRAKVEMEALMDLSPVGVSVFDTRIGEITFVNQESKRLLGALGLSDDEWEFSYDRLTFTRTDGKEIPFAELPGTRALQTGESVRAEEIVVHRPDGSSITTLLNCAPLFSESGEMVSLMSVVQDMTPLEDVERRRGEFLGRVSEELRTPLATIKGSIMALTDFVEAVPSTEASHLLRIIDQQIDLMRSQVNSLIELTEIEAGSLSVLAESTDVSALIRKTCGEYLRDHVRVPIQLDVPQGLPPVMADKSRIAQVLHNLLRQAAKLSSDSSPVKVSACTSDIYIAISVSVEGSIAPADRTSSPFTVAGDGGMLKRLSVAHSIKSAELASEGEGLASAFCRGIVEAHGGRMRTQADEAEGRLTLTFTLPSVEDEEQFPLPDDRSVSGDAIAAPGEKTRVLVSSEDPKLLSIVRRVLIGAGYDCVTASGMDEVEYAASTGGANLLLLDIAGREEECFRTLRRDGKLMNLPAIVLCDRDDEDYIVRVFDMGADGYLVKPFSPSEMVARVNATLRRMNFKGNRGERNVFQIGDVKINFYERVVTVFGQPIQLTATEYKLLSELSNYAGRILTQDELLQRVWGVGYEGESQLLRSYVKSLRQKLGDNARDPSYIFTEHGIGYRMAKTCPKSPEPRPGSEEIKGTLVASNGGKLTLLKNGPSPTHH